MFIHELNTAKQLARAAGSLALKWQSNLQITEKPFQEGPVTNADKDCDALICEGIRTQFPNDALISEESYTSEEIPSTGRVWFIDPIDGTSEYIRGGEDYCIMIGLCMDASPVMGVVYQPTTDVLWQGIYLPHHQQALCEYKDGSQFHLSLPRSETTHPLKAAVSRNHPSKLADFLLNYIGVQELIPKGSLGLKFSLIADQGADLYIAGSRRIKLWDTCAPAAILQAAGGLVSDLRNAPLLYHTSIAHHTPILARTPYAETIIRNKLDSAIVAFSQAHPASTF